MMFIALAIEDFVQVGRRVRLLTYLACRSARLANFFCDYFDINNLRPVMRVLSRRAWQRDNY